MWKYIYVCAIYIYLHPHTCYIHLYTTSNQLSAFKKEESRTLSPELPPCWATADAEIVSSANTPELCQVASLRPGVGQ